MGLMPTKKDDPISARTRALNAEIAALEAQIRDLDAQLVVSQSAPETTAAAPSASLDPAFVPIERTGIATVEAENASGTETPYNELGVRKYDLAAAWQRMRTHFQGPAASNPRLINYLAAGSIQGLRPLRYEKRVARNRVMALALVFLFVLWGLIAILRR